MEEQKLVMKYFGEEEFGNIIKYASENRHCLFDLPTLLNIHPFFREDFNAAKTLEEQKSIIDAADRVYEICTTDGKKICFLIKEKDFDEFQIFLNPENWGKTDKPITYDIILLSGLDDVVLEKENTGKITIIKDHYENFMTFINVKKEKEYNFVTFDLPTKHFSEVIKRSLALNFTSFKKTPYLSPIDIKKKLEHDGKALFLLNHREHLVTCLAYKTTSQQNPIQLYIFDSLLLNSEEPIKIQSNSIIYDIFDKKVEIKHVCIPILQFFGDCEFFSYATRIIIENMINDGILKNSEDAEKLFKTMKNIYNNNYKQNDILNYGFLNIEENRSKITEKCNNALFMLNNDLKTLGELQENLKRAKELLEYILKQQLLQNKQIGQSQSLLLPEKLNAILEELSQLLIPNKIELSQAAIERNKVKIDILADTNKWIKIVEGSLIDNKQREENLKQKRATTQKACDTLESLKKNKNGEFAVITMF